MTAGLTDRPLRNAAARCPRPWSLLLPPTIRSVAVTGGRCAGGRARRWRAIHDGRPIGRPGGPGWSCQTGSCSPDSSHDRPATGPRRHRTGASRATGRLAAALARARAASAQAFRSLLRPEGLPAEAAAQLEAVFGRIGGEIFSGGPGRLRRARAQIGAAPPRLLDWMSGQVLEHPASVDDQNAVEVLAGRQARSIATAMGALQLALVGGGGGVHPGGRAVAGPGHRRGYRTGGFGGPRFLRLVQHRLVSGSGDSTPPASPSIGPRCAD